MDKFLHLEDLLQAYSRIAHIPIYHLLVLVVTGDIITGFAKAVVNERINSSIGIKGLSKHFMVISICFLFAPYMWLVGFGSIAKVLLTSMIVMYTSSIVENLDEMGVPLPSKITKFLEQVNERNETFREKE